MEYYIDGYNLIFSLVEPQESLQILRQRLISVLRKKFAAKKAKGLIVFDGKHRKEEESGLSYPSPLVVAYAPLGQSADAYILERIENAKHPKQITVVTNDRGLARAAKAYGAQVLPNEPFLTWLYKKKKESTAKESRESKTNFDRLLKIFEERFRSPEND